LLRESALPPPRRRDSESKDRPPPKNEDAPNDPDKRAEDDDVDAVDAGPPNGEGSGTNVGSRPELPEIAENEDDDDEVGAAKRLSPWWPLCCCWCWCWPCS
jgi:hypothetical protein